MRSLFGALFGLVIGILVSALLKNNQLFETIKEILKQPSSLSLIFVLAIFGWVIGVLSISSKKIKKSITYYNMVTILSLAAMGVVITVFTQSPWIISILYLFITAFIWVVIMWATFYFRKKENSD